LVLDIEKEKLPFGDNSVDEIVAMHVLEHIFRPDPVMNELHRVLKPGGKMLIEVPKAGTHSFWKDPTHVRGWIMETFRYYCDWNTDPANERETWKMGECKEFMRGDDYIIGCTLIK
jgi:ubiquinone/menaquinone biosynthesis C-methylase UbiE